MVIYIGVTNRLYVMFTLIRHKFIYICHLSTNINVNNCFILIIKTVSALIFTNNKNLVICKVSITCLHVSFKFEIFFEDIVCRN